jgi:peptide/nickel transport system substrate-binding protein
MAIQRLICVILLSTLVLAACTGEEGATGTPERIVQPTPTTTAEATATSVAIVAEESAAEDTAEIAISEFSEAPTLAERVAAGQLPPVEERLPEDVQVIEPVEGVGEYGGIWYTVSSDSSIGDIRMITYDPPIRWKPDYTGYEPGLLKSWEISDDGLQVTWHFRQGVRWSDGEPFTTDDLRFWWEDLVINPDLELLLLPPWLRNSDGSPMEISFPDDYTMVVRGVRPQYTSVFQVAQGFWWWESMMKPRHYLEQFHPRYTEGASYGDLEQADKWWETPGYPTLYAWMAESVTPGQRVVLVRNPYYWKVDVAGNQLPYIDRLDVTIIPGKEAAVLEASQGKFSAAFRGIGDPTDIPFLLEQARTGGYHLHPGAVNGAGGWPCWIVNQDYDDRSKGEWEEIRDLLRARRFRQALSHALDRERVIDVAWDGVGTPQQGTISPQSWHFASAEGQKVYQEWANAYIEHDPELAMELLNEAGMVDADGDGWRDLPSGRPFELVIDIGLWGGEIVPVASTEVFAGNLEDVGVKVLQNNLQGSPEFELRAMESSFMLQASHASELDIWSFPSWIFPVDEGSFPWRLEGKWYMTGGAEGVEPTAVAKALWGIYQAGLVEPDVEKRHQYVWDAIRIHIDEGPFFIGAAGDQQEPVVIADNFHGVPDLVVLGPWAPGTPGNLHPEQFWIEQ